ncbi:MAG: tandem-95 repeat protein [Parasynechococcus sp.]|uniref:tandem-95 repeat protein n=1 Tax=Parasynechococcus sp. TaxID=3101203 RepID=UPI003885BCCC
MALTLEITSSASELLNGETATFTFNFSEELVLNETSAFTSSDISAKTDDGISLGNFTDLQQSEADPTIYTATFTPTENLIASGNVFIAFNSVRTVSGEGWENRDALAPVSIITKTIYALSNSEGTSDAITLEEGTEDSANPITFKISRSGDTRAAGSVNWNVIADDSVSTTVALADASDFSPEATQLPGGVVNFAENQTDQTIIVNISQDKTYEANEIFRLALSEASTANGSPSEIPAEQSSIDVTLTTDDPDSIDPVITSGDKAGEDGFIQENSHHNEIIYRATATDTSDQILTPSSANITFSLKEEDFNAQNDSELFSIDELTGDVRLTFDPDFENPKDAGSNPDIADNIYGFVVVATDQAGNTAEKRVSLEVQDIQLAPIATSPSRVSINENTGAPQPIYTTQIEDYPYPMMYGLKNVNDSESFTIDVSTGIVSLKSTEFPDFETKNSYNFTVTLNGEEGNSEKAVALTINNVDEAAAITGNLTASTDEDTSVTGKISATDPEGLSDGSYFSIATNNSPDNGTASINRESGSWVYSPSANFHGSDDFTVTVTDDGGGTTSQLISISINPTPDAPVISGDLSGTGLPFIGDPEKDQPIRGTIEVTDPDNRIGTSSSFKLVEGSSPTSTGGAAAISEETGYWSYFPKKDYRGPDTFAVQITDATGSTTEQTILISVDDPATNESAAIGGDISGQGEEDSTTPITGTLTALDVEGLTSENIFSISRAASNGDASIDASTGTWSYTPKADFSGTDTFTVSVTDDQGGTTDQAISITIGGVIDPVSTPDLTNDSGRSSTDNITNANNPSFSGTADSGADVEVRITTSGNPNTSTSTFSLVGVANSLGVWNLTLGDDVALTDGTYTVTATSTIDGETATSDPLTITVDTTSPVITSGATPTGGDDNAGSQSIIYKTVANDASPLPLKFSLKPDNDDDAASFTINPDSGDIRLNSQKPIEVKTAYALTVVATDAAGNAAEQLIALTRDDLGQSAPQNTDQTPTFAATPSQPASSPSSGGAANGSAPSFEAIPLETSAGFEKSQSGDRILAQAPRGDVSIPSSQTEKLKVLESADDGIEIELTDTLIDLDLTSRSSNVVFGGRKLKSSTVRFEEGLIADLVSTAELVKKTSFVMTEGKDKATFNSGVIKKSTIEAGGGKDDILIGEDATLTNKTMVDLGSGKDKLTIQGEVKKAQIDLGDDNQKDKVFVDSLDLITKKLVIKSFGQKDKLVIDGETYNKSAIEDEDQRIGKIRVRFLDATTNGSSNNNDSSDLTSVIASNGFDFL